MATKRFLKRLIDMGPINILGTDYDLVLHSKKWIMEGTPGTVNFPHAKIYVDTDLSDDRIIEVLLHEILEVIKDRFTLDTVPHMAICAFEVGIIDVLRHNNEFRKALGIACMETKGNTYTNEDFVSKNPDDQPIPMQKEEIRSLLRKKKKEDKSRGTEEEKATQEMVG